MIGEDLKLPSCFLVGAWVSSLTLVFLLVYTSVSASTSALFVYLLFFSVELEL